jgi:diguanylate cyclase (GGDEF)-like protein
MILEWQTLGAAAVVVAAVLVAALILLRLERRDSEHKPEPASSEIDALTGLRNRASLDSELRRRCIPGRDAAVLWLDLDHFKKINDSHGHDAGDRALKEFAGVLASQVRSSDIAARYGGDEFIVVLPNGGSRGASSLASRILEAARRHAFSTDSMTVSIGIAASQTDGPSTWEGLLKSADQAMYRAKQAGRDRVEM